MGSRDYIKLGSHNMYCESCKAKRKIEELRKRWDNLWVCNVCFELRHPMDSFRAPRPGPTAKPINASHITAVGLDTTFFVMGEIGITYGIGDVLEEVGVDTPGKPLEEA